MISNKPHLRTVRSFACRGRRLTSKQQKAVAEIGSTHCLPLQNNFYDLNKVFDRTAPKILEIGFGMGNSLVAQAKQNPEQDFIGVEVHKPGIAAVLAEITEHKLSNIRIFEGDAVQVLKNCITGNTLTCVQLFFPDPWPKRRHHKRRIVQTEFVQLIHHKLITHGRFHLATDWEDYAKQMMLVLNQFDGFKNVNSAGSFSPTRLNRIPTKFELRGQKLGHEIWDLVFEKI